MRLNTLPQWIVVIALTLLFPVTNCTFGQTNPVVTLLANHYGHKEYDDPSGYYTFINYTSLVSMTFTGQIPSKITSSIFESRTADVSGSIIFLAHAEDHYFGDITIDNYAVTNLYTLPAQSLYIDFLASDGSVNWIGTPLPPGSVPTQPQIQGLVYVGSISLMTNFISMPDPFDFDLDDLFPGPAIATVTGNGSSFTGLVEDAATRNPIPGATVVIGGQTFITDSNGSFFVSLIPPGPLTIQITDSGYVPYQATKLLPPFSSIQQTFTLTNATIVTGHVYCSCDNSVASGVTVQIGSYSATTDASGSYTTTGIPPGTYSVTVSGPNYYAAPPPMTISSQSSPITSDFTLTPLSSSVTGHVYCSCDNSPVSNVTVKIGQYSAITDTSGGYSISCIPANTYSVTVSGPNYDTVLPSITISSPCSSIRNDVLLGLPADALKKSLVFPASLDGQSRQRWQMLAKFTPANGLSLQQAACVLGVDHFNWIQTISHPSYIHYYFTPINLPFPTTAIPGNLPITDPCPDIGMSYYIESDLSTYWVLEPNTTDNNIGDGSGFYWNEGAEVNGWHRDNEHSLVFKDTAKMPNGFLASGDGQQFVTRLVGVKQGGGYTFIGHLTGFTWHSDAVCDPQAAIVAGHVYGIYSLKETNDFSAVPVISGGVTNINYVPELENISVTNGIVSFTWNSFTGFVFQVQYTTNLFSGNWITLGSTITALNTVVSASDAIGSNQKRFYRVQQE